MKPGLLYVSPVLPARTGNGLAIRAGNVLRALAPSYRVHLHVLPLYARWDEQLVPELAALCDEVSEGPAVDAAPVDVLHVFRLAALPYARRCPAGERHADLDDIEPKTYRRLAALHRLNGEDERARLMENEARRYEPLEAEVLDSWERAYVCSEADRVELTGRGAEVRVLPNVVDQFEARASSRPDRPFTFLFVGTLGYYANEDAVRWFRSAVLPELRMIAPRPFRVVVVGGEGRSEQELEFAGTVPEVGPWYEGADAAIVPLRAGGGTRIKILEAFARSLPVVSTPLGAEGLAVESGQHLLLGESATDFAGQCAELMTNAALARRLIDRARRLVAASHSPGVAAAAVVPAEPPPRSARRADAARPRPS